MIDIKLSDRMNAVVRMVNEASVADIGCDHAFVAMYLIKSGKAKKVVAMDVKKGPLNIAKEHIKAHCLEDEIDVRLSNGFEKLAVGEVEGAIIAGMGGPLIVEILKRGKAHTDAGIHLVLQPQSEIWKVRGYLLDIGYDIISEDMLMEDDKYYTVIKAVPATEFIEPYSQLELLYGRRLMEGGSLVLKSYVQSELAKNEELFNKLEHIHTEKSRIRREELENEISLCNEVLANIK